MEFDIQQKPLTAEQTQFIAEEFAKLDIEIFHVRNAIKQYTFVIENPDYIGSLKARLSWGNFHIFELCVRKEMRRNGIGTNLIRHAVSVARKDKAQFISIKTSYIAAKRLYEKLGFQLHNTMQGYASELVFWTLVLKL